MAIRGPKPKTARKSRPRAGRIDHSSFDPPYPLAGVVLDEYWRLVDVLDNRGSLDRVDLAVVAECARISGLLARLYGDLGQGSLDSADLKAIACLTAQRRGLLRELGLTIKPSTTLVKTVAKNSNAVEAPAIAGSIKIG
jgi:hypothetical protein